MSEVELLKGVSAFDGDFRLQNADCRFNLRAQNSVARNACSLNLKS